MRSGFHQLLRRAPVLLAGDAKLDSQRRIFCAACIVRRREDGSGGLCTHMHGACCSNLHCELSS